MAFPTELFGGVGLTLLLLILAAAFFLLYNGLIFAKTNVQKAWANIDVLLKQRNDEIPNLLSTVKGYATYEKTTFEAVANARAAMLGAQTLADKAQASGALTQSLKTLFAVSENYPQLRASENFLQLQHRLTSLENQIADRREYYNDAVNTYNLKLEQIPDTFVARALKLKPEAYFSADAAERALPQVKLDS